MCLQLNFFARGFPNKIVYIFGGFHIPLDLINLTLSYHLFKGFLPCVLIRLRNLSMWGEYGPYKDCRATDDVVDDDDDDDDDDDNDEQYLIGLKKSRKVLEGHVECMG
jgi:hypothetical protein